MLIVQVISKIRHEKQETVGRSEMGTIILRADAGPFLSKTERLLYETLLQQTCARSTKLDQEEWIAEVACCGKLYEDGKRQGVFPPLNKHGGDFLKRKENQGAST